VAERNHPLLYGRKGYLKRNSLKIEKQREIVRTTVTRADKTLKPAAIPPNIAKRDIGILTMISGLNTFKKFTTNSSDAFPFDASCIDIVTD